MLSVSFMGVTRFNLRYLEQADRGPTVVSSEK